MYYYKLKPSNNLRGSVTVPGDKSISHRALMLGAIANGVTHIENFLSSDDCLATLEAFKAMGVSIDGPTNGDVTIHGVGKHGLQAANQKIDLGNSGTSIRLLTGLLAAQNFKSTLTGDDSLLKRPMDRVANPLSEMGAHITTYEGRPPVNIEPNGAIKAIDYSLPTASAQVKSAILLAALYADGTTSITEPAVTRNHTERMLRSFSYPIETNSNGIKIQGGDELIATDIKVPGDLSSAAFFIVGATVAPGSEITIKNVGVNPTRSGVIEILKLMGADISLSNQRNFGNEPVADLKIKYAPLKGINIPTQLVSLAIDEFPAIFIAAACAQGKTTLRGADELKHKESDRIKSMADGLQALGIEAEVFADGIAIKGAGPGREFTGGEINSHGDHRIAMAFAMAALRCKHPLTIKNTKNVTTSFPNFAKIAAAVGLNITQSC